MSSIKNFLIATFATVLVLGCAAVSDEDVGIDCGEDIECFNNNALTCTPAFVVHEIAPVTLKLNMLGGAPESCPLRVKLVDVDLPADAAAPVRAAVPIAKRSSMECQLTSDEIINIQLTEETLDRCEGSLADILGTFTGLEVVPAPEEEEGEAGSTAPTELLVAVTSVTEEAGRQNIAYEISVRRGWTTYAVEVTNLEGDAAGPMLSEELEAEMDETLSSHVWTTEERTIGGPLPPGEYKLVVTDTMDVSVSAYARFTVPGAEGPAAEAGEEEPRAEEPEAVEAEETGSTVPEELLVSVTSIEPRGYTSWDITYEASVKRAAAQYDAILYDAEGVQGSSHRRTFDVNRVGGVYVWTVHEQVMSSSASPGRHKLVLSDYEDESASAYAWLTLPEERWEPVPEEAPVDEVAGSTDPDKLTVAVINVTQRGASSWQINYEASVKRAAAQYDAAIYSTEDVQGCSHRRTFDVDRVGGVYVWTVHEEMLIGSPIPGWYKLVLSDYEDPSVSAYAWLRVPVPGEEEADADEEDVEAGEADADEEAADAEDASGALDIPKLGENTTSTVPDGLRVEVTSFSGPAHRIIINYTVYVKRQAYSREFSAFDLYYVGTRDMDGGVLSYGGRYASMPYEAETEGGEYVWTTYDGYDTANWLYPGNDYELVVMDQYNQSAMASVTFRVG